MTDNPFALDYVEPKHDDIFDAFDRERTETVKPDHRPAKAAAAKKEYTGKRGMVIHPDVMQGSEEWHNLRLGLITASEIKYLLSPKTLKPLNNDKTRSHIWELAAQRITKHIEPTYIGDEMLRGHTEEIIARDLFSKHYSPVKNVGFITNDEWGYTLGCSPDGLVGDDEGNEHKSRRQKFQVQTIVEHFRHGTMPEEHLLQVQFCMLVTKRPCWNYVSFSGGMPMLPIRVKADPAIHEAILAVTSEAERQITDAVSDYNRALEKGGWVPTERTVEQEMHL